MMFRRGDPTLDAHRIARASSTDAWSQAYASRLAVTDFLAIAWSVVGTQIAWFGVVNLASTESQYRGELGLSYTLISALLILGWMIALALFATRDARVIGTGSTEYKRVVDATIRVFGIVAAVAFLLKLDLARGYILTSLPLGLLALLASRWIWRQWLSLQRSRGLYSSKVLLVGSRTSVTAIARALAGLPEAGYLVVGACIPGDTVGEYLLGGRIPVSSKLDQVLTAMEATGADTVIVTSSDELSSERIRELSWSLERGRQHLVMAPSLTDIGGPRIHTRPVAGLPLIHVEIPRYEGRKQFAKRMFDLVGSAVLLIVLSLPLLALAGLIGFSSAGPVFYKQERIGLNGRPFWMLKFRSMNVNADAELEQLLATQGTNGKPLFKVQNDPRLTRVGAMMRRHSLDEFPQLLNVFKGDMSLVGPRPQREGEVALYDSAARRRLIVQPGMTGLWQVSGRSTLSWEDAIRLDLYYVENWSVTGDIVILWRTLRAVLAPGNDAY